MKRIAAAILAIAICGAASAQTTTTNPSQTGVGIQSSVVVTGGTINGTTVGASTPATGAFTTLSATGALTAGAGTFSGGIRSTGTTSISTGSLVQMDFSSGGRILIAGIDAGTAPTLAVTLLNNAGGVFASPAVFSSTGLAVTGTATVSAIASNTGAQSGYLCYNTSGGVITYDASNTCLISREEYKDIRGPIKSALPTVMALRPIWASYKHEAPFQDFDVHPMFGAHQVDKVDKRLTSHTADGAVRSVRYQEMTAVLARAIQEQQAEINLLKRQVKALEQAQYASRTARTRPAAYRTNQ